MDVLSNFITGCPIVYFTDDKFISPTIISIHSLLKNFVDTNIDIVVAHRGLSNSSLQDLDKFIEYWKEYKNINYQTFDVRQLNMRWDLMQYQMDGTSPRSHFNGTEVEIMFRLWLAEFVSASKCVYLDSDTVVVGDISSLIHIPLESDIYVRGCKTHFCSAGPSYEKWLNGREWHYVNSGVLHWNLDAIRENNVLDRFIEEMGRNVHRHPDQDIINIVCYDNLTYIPLNYNVESIVRREWFMYHGFGGGPYNDTDFHDVFEDSKIIHYTGRSKPHYIYAHEQLTEWDRAFCKDTHPRNDDVTLYDFYVNDILNLMDFDRNYFYTN